MTRGRPRTWRARWRATTPITWWRIADDGAIDAYAGLLAPLGTGQGDIQTITVAPRARRQGLGRTLMLALINEARRRGAEELFLEVRADNENAQALYTDARLRGRSPCASGTTRAGSTRCRCG